MFLTAVLGSDLLILRLVFLPTGLVTGKIDDPKSNCLAHCLELQLSKL